jgi:Clostridial hydrophobic W
MKRAIFRTLPCGIVLGIVGFAAHRICERPAMALQFGSICPTGSLLQYRAWMANIGWGPWTCDGATAGSIGESRRIEAVQIVSLDSRLGVCYQVHASGIGWMGATAGGESCDGALAGTQGQSRQIEAIKVRMTGPLSDGRAACYRAYVADYGWVSESYDWGTSGTTGQSRRMEAMWLHDQCGKPPCPPGGNYAMTGGEGAFIGFSHNFSYANPSCTGGQYAFHCGSALCYVNLASDFQRSGNDITFSDVAGASYELTLGDHGEIAGMWRNGVFVGASSSGP